MIERVSGWVHRKAMLILRIASLLAILGLLFMVWSVVQPTPMPVILAMSIGQGIGSLSFLLYLIVVAVELRKRKVLEEPPP